MGAPAEHVGWVKAVSHPRLPPAGRLLCGAVPPEPFEESIEALTRAGVQAVVCLLEDRELPAGLLHSYQEAGLDVVRFPIPDFCAPEAAPAFGHLLIDLLGRLARGQGVFVHCRGGIGRTGTVLACLLKTVGEGSDPVEIARAIYIRGALESPEQRRFVQEFSPRRR